MLKFVTLFTNLKIYGIKIVIFNQNVQFCNVFYKFIFFGFKMLMFNEKMLFSIKMLNFITIFKNLKTLWFKNVNFE